MMMSLLTACQGTQNDAPVESTDKVETPSPTETPSVPDTNEDDDKTTEGSTETPSPSPTDEPTETPTPTSSPEPTPEPHEHSYVEKVTKEATCTAAGELTHTCEICGDAYITEIAKIEHKYKETVVKATCTENGYTKYECTCGDSYKDKETKATGHSFTHYVYDNNATKDANGTNTAVCDNYGCTATDSQVVIGTILEPIWTDCNKTMYAKPSLGVVGIWDAPQGDIILATLQKGEAVTVTGTSVDTHMCRVSWNGIIGYVMCSELSETNPNPTPTPTPTPEEPKPNEPTPTPTYTIENVNFDAYSRGRLYFYNNPDKTGDTENYIPRLNRFTVTGICKETGMYRASYNGMTGYINPAMGILKTPEEFPYALNTLYENGNYQMYFYYNADDKSQMKEVAQRAHALLREKADAMGYISYMVDEANTVDPNNITKDYHNIYCITINLTIYE